MDVDFTTISSKGQLVIPARLRKKLGILEGTRVAVREENGRLVLQPLTGAYIDATQGLLGDTTAMIEYLHQERRKENSEQDEKIRTGRKRAASFSRPAARSVSRKRSA